MHSVRQLDIRGIVVPQKVFSARGQMDWVPLPPIQFRVNGQLGLRLRDALRYQAARTIPGLQDEGENPTLSNTSIRVTMRIQVSTLTLPFVFWLILFQWPGYEPWTDANGIHQFVHGFVVNVRNREHIAWQVARSIKTFYDVSNHFATSFMSN